MAKDIKLSDIGSTNTPRQKPTSLMETEDMELNRVKTDYNLELNNRKMELKSKITSLEKKLSKHELKEGMLDRIISETYTELDNLKETEFTRRGQKQTVLIKQMEALSILHDTILKYEGMIQAYFKILIDIDNNKLNSFIKLVNLRKEEKKADEGLGAILLDLQEMMKNADNPNSAGSPLIDDLKQELLDEDY